jgi:hypothetical protein
MLVFVNVLLLLLLIHAHSAHLAAYPAPAISAMLSLLSIGQALLAAEGLFLPGI